MDTINGNAKFSEEKSVSKRKNSSVSNDEHVYYKGMEDEGEYGWFCWTPKWIQFMNKPIGYLVFFGMFLIVQGS